VPGNFKALKSKPHEAYAMRIKTFPGKLRIPFLRVQTIATGHLPPGHLPRKITFLYSQTSVPGQWVRLRWTLSGEANVWDCIFQRGRRPVWADVRGGVKCPPSLPHRCTKRNNSALKEQCTNYQLHIQRRIYKLSKGVRPIPYQTSNGCEF